MLIFAYHFKNRQKYENEFSNLQRLPNTKGSS